jgi:dihydrofolate reductase
MINAIAALAKENRAIGNKGQIPWHIPEDFAHFKQKTIGHPIIMGRKTFETFPKPLPGRTHIVITRDKEYKVPEGVFVCDSIEKAIEVAREKDGGEEIFIIGGGQIYTESLPFVERLYLTLIDGDFEGDAFFPEYSEFKNKIEEETHSNEKNTFTFVTLER